MPSVTQSVGIAKLEQKHMALAGGRYQTAKVMYIHHNYMYMHSHV